MSPSNQTSKDERQATRPRVARMRKEQHAKERRRAALIWGAATVAVLAIVGATAVIVVREQSDIPSLDAVQTFPVSQGHVSTPVKYAQTPPAGGEHSAIWLNCGIYDKPVPNENAVHDLEHGAVWVTYRPEMPKTQVDQLRKAMPETYTLLSPYPGLKAPVVASAWGKQLALSGPEDKRLPEFIRTYRQGPQTPEPGAACTGGTGTPMAS